MKSIWLNYEIIISSKAPELEIVSRLALSKTKCYSQQLVLMVGLASPIDWATLSFVCTEEVEVGLATCRK